MHACIDRRPVILAASSCGIFTNLGPSAASRRDRADGLWYWHLHTPWFAVQLYATTDGPSFAYLGRTRYFTTRTPRHGRPPHSPRGLRRMTPPTINPTTATPQEMVRWLLADASPDTLTEWASLWLNALSHQEMREYVEAALPPTRQLTDTEHAVLRGMLP